jgi:hypothetical protein
MGVLNEKRCNTSLHNFDGIWNLFDIGKLLSNTRGGKKRRSKKLRSKKRKQRRRSYKK